MQIYLPIADVPVNVFPVLGMGLAVGYISCVFGIRGGFLMTPLLIFIGISPARTGQTMSGERLRLLLGLLVFAVGCRFAYELIVQPDDLYSLRYAGTE